MAAPKLASPGEGIPFLERFFVRRFILPRLKKKWSWDDADRIFARETGLIIGLIGDLTPEQRKTRVLVPRLAGMEDSSRYWSVDLTLEHLMIVVKGMSDIVIHLSQGKPFPHNVAIADVKPRGILGENAVIIFGDVMKQAEDYLNKNVSDRHSVVTHAHPWFGAMDAADWHNLMAMHHSLHRRQIEKIVSGLK